MLHTFSSFLLITLIFLFGIFLFVDFREGKVKQSIRFYLIGFLVLVGFSFWTLHSYFYPSGAIAKNTDFHIVEHQGYEFQDSILLISSSKPKKAIWSQYSGELSVKSVGDSFKISSVGVYSPIYISKSNQKKEQRKRYEFANRENYSISFRKNVEIRTPDSSVYLKLFVREINQKKAVYTLQTQIDGEQSSSRFHSLIYMYYDVADILAKTNELKGFAKTWENCYLLREERGSPNVKVNRKKFPEAYRLLLSEKLLTSDSISFRADGQADFTPLQTSEDFAITVSNQSSLFIGLGRKQTPIFRPENSESGSISKIVFVEPKKYKVKGKKLELGKKAVFGFSSQPDTVSNSELAEGNGNGVYYFGSIPDTGNLNHINAEVEYEVNASDEKLLFSLTDFNSDGATKKRELSTKNTFRLETKNHQSELAWQMRFVDRRDENKLKTHYIYLFLASFLLLVIFRYTALYKANNFSRIELSIYVLLYAFLLIRVYLQWRISTFYPISNIDIKQYNAITNSETHFLWTAGFTYGFLLIWFLKLKIWQTESVFKTKLAESIRTLHIPFLLFLGGAVFSFAHFGVTFFERISNLFIPVVLFYTIDSALIHFNSKSDGWFYLSIRKKIKQAVSKTPLSSVSTPSILKNIPYLRAGSFGTTFLVILMNDAGYAIMFLLYAFIHFVLLGIALKQYPNLLPISRNRIVAFSIATLIFVAGIFYQANLIIFGIENIPILTWVLLIVWLATGIFWQIRFGGFILDFAQSKWMKKIKLLNLGIFLFGACIILAFSISKTPEKLSKKYSYIKYRAGVLKSESSELILSKPFKSEAFQSVLQSAHNQWLINYFTSDSHVSSNTIDLEEQYMKLQPHFSQGASHITQTSDLIVPRYLISEHSEWLVLELIACFGMLCLIFFGSIQAKFKLAKTQEGEAHFSLLGVPVLLFTTALFVWMTSTNRFTFFGQDFPLISVASKITLLLTFGLFLLLLIFYKPKYERQEKLFSTLTTKPNPESVLYFLVGFCLCVVIFQNKSRGFNQSYFNLEKVISETSSAVVKLNKNFILLQQNSEQDTISIQPENEQIDSLLYKFHQLNLKSIPKTNQLRTKHKFIQTAYESYFLNEQANKLDENELIHLRKIGDYYLFATNRKYFFMESPRNGN
ncbi:MAG: hypothetical protein ACJAWV_001102 [Flammeovirgaceae bacterium]|jgi:hypothetical protein